VAEAEAQGVDLVLFPETYPGPYTETCRYDVEGPLSDAARRHGVAVAAGTTVETSPGSGAYYVAHVVIDEHGEVLGHYRRTHPGGDIYGPLYRGAFWNIEYQAGSDYPVFDMSWGKLGIGICSEVFMPEVARILALKGAEVCLFPSGVFIADLGYMENWQTVVRARAIENLTFTAATCHLFPPEFVEATGGVVEALPSAATTASGLTAGNAMIVSPEEVLTCSREPGLLVADLDLERLRRLRSEYEEIAIPQPFRTIPRVLPWRRPELFSELTEPVAAA
jgi:predicted amidohydrolase